LELDEDGRQSNQGQAHLNRAIDLLKTRTRRLCKSQRNWHKHRLVRKAERGQIPNFLTLNTDGDFFGQLVPFVTDNLMSRFLRGETIPSQNSPEWDSNPLVMHLPIGDEIKDQFYARDANRIYHCADCNLDIQSKKCYEHHLRGGRHRWVVSSKKHKAEWAANAAAAAAQANSEADHSGREEGIDTAQRSPPSRTDSVL